MAKVRVLYVHRFQFGYNAPVLNSCRYLRKVCDLHIVSLDCDRPIVDLPGAVSTVVSSSGGRYRRFLALVRTVIVRARHDFDLVWVSHFPGALLIPLLGPKRKYVLDIRTGSVSPRRLSRLFYNGRASLDSLFFDGVAVISEGLRKRLCIPERRGHILPLGADEIVLPPKALAEKMHLLYVGTLSGRKIEQTLLGVYEYVSRSTAIPTLEYDIVGEGLESERASLENLVVELGLTSIVRFHGFVRPEDLRPFFERANIGVSFVPMTPYFDVQPPTKTFEYLLAGMPTIATNTAENRKIVTAEAGVLVADDAHSFAVGLAILRDRAQRYDSETIRDLGRSHTWRSIVETNMHPYIESLVQNSEPADAVGSRLG